MKCKNCQIESKGKYCSDKCKSQFYYYTKKEVRLKKIDNAKDKNKFYVYALVNKETDKIFYIGKGSGNRAYQITGRSVAFKVYTSMNDYYVKILKQNLNNKFALMYERKLINELPDLINIADKDIDRTMKICSRCKLKKNFEEDFYHNSSLSARCKECHNELNKIRKEESKFSNEKNHIRQLIKQYTELNPNNDIIELFMKYGNK